MGRYSSVENHGEGNSRYSTEIFHYEKIIQDVVVLILASIVVLMAVLPVYGVWRQGLVGQAELQRATQNRQILVQEAQSKEDAAVHLANSEVARAHGVAEANKIIGDSLKGNESYLRYLWITEVANNQQGKTVVYVPTETNLPLLEAGKRE